MPELESDQHSSSEHLSLPPIELRNEDLHALYSRWLALMSRTAGTNGADVAKEFYTLLGMYFKPPRYYHNHTHVLDMLHKTSRVAHALSDIDAFELSVWFHDAVIDGSPQESVMLSSQYAANSMMRLGVETATASKVCTMIQASSHHLPNNAGDPNADLAIFLDTDLSILAADPGTYAAYAQAIRLENYRIPPGKYTKGRITFLQDVLNRQRIFISDQFSALEDRARQNITKEIERLSSEMLHNPGKE